jgi:hypothetical protein
MDDFLLRSLCASAFFGACGLAGRDALAAHRIADLVREASREEDECEPELLHVSFSIALACVSWAFFRGAVVVLADRPQR